MFISRILGLLLNPISNFWFSRKEYRALDIGPGKNPLRKFERLNISASWPMPHYIGDASKKLPFEKNTFDLVHASHVLEHIPWYKTQETLNEWYRVLKPGGKLEIHVPDGEYICRAFLEAEAGESDSLLQDGQFRFNSNKDPCLWAAYRIFAYGDGKGKTNHPNWHKAIFSKRLLTHQLNCSGFKSFRKLEYADLRVRAHASINLGISATK